MKRALLLLVVVIGLLTALSAVALADARPVIPLPGGVSRVD